MKFSWKMCFSTIMLSLFIFSIGGYVLISALFQSTYEREIANAGEENRMLQYSFVAYWSAAIQDMNLNRENVRQVADAMVEGMAGSELRIRISDGTGQIFYDNAKADPDNGLLETITKTSRGHMLRKTEDGYELQTASMVCLGEDQFLYLESIREVTELFEERESQYHIYRQWLTGLLIVQSILCYLMASWLLRPLRRLSRAAKRMAGGNLSARARMESRDEIGDLAADFNHMADNLEQQFQELEDAARRQEDFIGSFAHELKTPLTSMIGYADMLRSTEVTREEQFEAANYIFKEGKRLESLSFKLLDLMVVKNQELELKPVKIRWLAEDIKGMLEEYAADRHIDLNLNENCGGRPPDAGAGLDEDGASQSSGQWAQGHGRRRNTIPAGAKGRGWLCRLRAGYGERHAGRRAVTDYGGVLYGRQIQIQAAGRRRTWPGHLPGDCKKAWRNDDI